MKRFSAYCIFLLQASEEAGAEAVNAPVDPDGEVQFHNEVQSSATQIEVKTFHYPFTNTLYSAWNF